MVTPPKGGIIMEEKKEVKKKKNSGLKKTVAGLFALVLIVGTTIALTLAFLKTTSETVTNTFTASEDIKLGLDEPNYNEQPTYDTDGKVTGTEPKDPTLPDPNKYVPDQIYPKDPTLYNLTGTSQGSQEWVALKVDYKIGNKVVTIEQLTHDCEGYLGDNRDDTNSVCPDVIDKDGNKSENNICDYCDNGGAGVIEAIDFDIGDDGGDTVNGTGSWFKLSQDQIKALLGKGSDDDDLNYEIYVYKYKLTENASVKNVADAQVDGYEAAGLTTKTENGETVTLSNNGVKTTPLFESIETKTKEQLIKNGYVADDDDTLLDAPQFKITLKGAAVKNDSTVKEDTLEISLADVNETITEKNDGDDDDTETDSYKIVKELVTILNAAS